jgi:ABC-type Fe3+-siderophore transport system permease subunit
MFVTKVLGVGTEGFGVGAVVIVLPVYSIVFGLLVWLPLWFLHNRFMGEMSARRALLIGLAIGFVVAILLSGLRSFGPSPGAEYFGWAILAVLGIGGWTHNKIIHR